ncbi:hypothetical protein LSCM4_04247 [Leishmania orientalis]|uniref:ABC transporter domain-containing protein n=1 Tax=Leishmania orientalis TaxID=2249476 RepID=A0A836GKW8_9TRYP|nr:hypothetical protein LSCM4_04247 [Leishmania orientalis]
MTAFGEALCRDAPAASNSMLEQATNPPLLSSAEINLNLCEDHHVTESLSEESLERGGQAGRRSVSSTLGRTTQSPRGRRLGAAARALMTDTEMSSLHSRGRNSHATVLPSLHLSRLAPLQHANSSYTPPETPNFAYDCQPLLSSRPREVEEHRSSAPSITNVAGKSRLFYSTEMPLTQPAADAESGSQEPPAPRRAATRRDGGIELSMDGVTLRKPRRCWLRRWMVTHLDSCSLRIPPGSVHCITSLNSMNSRCALALLAGVEAVTQCEGAVLANAYPTTALRYRRHVGYVSSLNGIIREATVFQNLRLATHLRFHVDDPTGRQLIRKAAADALLTGYLDARASLLSPAHRYLLALAMELVSEPIVLLLEDPLSFFSLAQLQLFVCLLRRLRRRNPSGTVVWSSSTIPWTLFDDIDCLTLLSSNGKTFYTGHKKDVEAFLQEGLGILHVPSEEVVDIMAQTELDTAAVTHASFSFRNSRYYRQLRHDIEAHRSRISANAFVKLPEGSCAPPRYLRVQWLLLAYALHGNVLSKAALVPWLGLLLINLLACALVARADDKGQGDMHNVCGVLFLLFSCSVQINSIFLKAELRNRRAFQSLKSRLHISVIPYFVATIVRLGAPRLCFALAGCICAAVLFQKATVVTISIMMALTSFTHVCLALVAVYWLPYFDYLLLLHHVYYGFCVVVSGFLVRLTSFPGFLQFLSILRIGYGGSLATVLRGHTFGCDAAPPGPGMMSSSDSSSSTRAALTPSPLCYTGQQYLDLVGFSDDSWRMSALLLLLLSVGIMFALGISMYIDSGAALLSST